MRRKANAAPSILAAPLLIGLLLASLAFIAPAQAQETDIFRDNLESYAVGAFPSAGGWEIVWDGMGAGHQVISTTYSYSPTKSLQLWGRYYWTAAVQRKFSTDAPVIGYELSILIEGRGSEHGDHPAFFCREAATWGAYYGTVLFDHSDGRIKAEDGRVLGTWSPKTWYRVKVILDRRTNRYSVWINGELRGRDIPTSRPDTNKINAIVLVAGWHEKKVYYDDVRVFTVAQQNYRLTVRLDSATLNGQGLSTSNPELRVTPGSRITGTVTFTVENVQPGSWITPVIWVTSWEKGSTSDGRVRVVASDVRATKQFTVSIDARAPSSPGTYYIGFFCGWMYSPDEVASNDHPPKYGDGDDVWDMRVSDWESVIKNGQAPEGAVYRMPGRAIRVVVEAAGELLPLPAGARSEDPSNLRLDESRLLVDINIAGSGQTAHVRPGETVSGTLTYQIYSGAGNPSEINQGFLIMSWTPSWPPPEGYYIPIWDGISGVYPGVRGTKSFSFKAPSTPGTYYLYWCGGAEYGMKRAVAHYNRPLAPPAHAKIVVEEYYLKADLSRAIVNGQPLRAENPEISVQPGAKIEGLLEVVVNNKRGGAWITPVIGTVSWGRQLTGQSKGWFVTIAPDAPTGSSTQRFEFSLTAPTAPGTYYIGIFTGWMYSGEEVASNDHPARFGDGDDVWDMPSQGWEEVISKGAASTGPYRMPGRAIRIIVVQPQYYLRVGLDSITLNGQSLAASNPELEVSPGASISGSVTFTVENVQPGSWITPVVWVTSWERGSVADGKVRVVSDDIRSTKQFTIPISLKAPSTPGVYYIGFFAGWMYSPDEVASGDHPPSYGDGDDVWDMKQSDWESVIKNGQAPEGAVYRMPGRAVRVIVKAVEEWVPYVPTSGQTEIEVSTAANAVLARVTLTFPSAGYRVADWGVVRRDGSELWVDARVERWTGPSAQVITPLSHVYNLGVLTPGAYKFTFKAWGQAVKSKAFEVSPLKITISANPTSGKAPLTVWFAASASGGIPPYGYEWSFGDGGTSAEQSPSHTYAKPGLYVARCTVRDSAGAQSAAEVTIRVEAEAVALSFQPSEGSVTQGDIYEVKVVASQVSKLDTAVFTLSFDPSVLEFVEAKAGELMPNAEVASNVVSSGRVRVLVSQPLGAAGVTGSGSIAVIRLRAVGPSGSSTTLSLLDVSLADSDGNPIRATTMSGSVKVTQITDTTPPSVTVISPNGGEVWLSGELHAVKWTASDNVGVTKVDIFYSTDGGRSWAPIALGVPNTGSYNWKVPNVTSMNCLVKVDAYDAANNKGGDASDSLFTIVLKGDMNRDGRLDTGDATIILRKVVGLEPTSPEDVLIGDMNGSKALDSGDATIVLKRVVGLE